jgi:AcrR family transcriptional regulator
LNRQASHSFILQKPSAQTRRERRKQEIQSFILEAAIELFGSQGYDATTVEQICERADISRQTLYSYYPTKAHLLSALSELSAIKTPEHLIAEARTRSDDALEQICLFIDSVAGNMGSSTALERTLRRDMMKYVEKVDESAATRWSYTGLLLADVIAAGQKARQISRAHKAAFLAEMIAGTMNSIAIRWSFDERYPYDEHLLALQNFLRATLIPAAAEPARKTPAAKKPAIISARKAAPKKAALKKTPSNKQKR